MFTGQSQSVQNELSDEFKLKCTQYVQVLDTVQITFSKVQYISTNLILQLTRPDWRGPRQELGWLLQTRQGTQFRELKKNE